MPTSLYLYLQPCLAGPQSAPLTTKSCLLLASQPSPALALALPCPIRCFLLHRLQSSYALLSPGPNVKPPSSPTKASLARPRDPSPSTNPVSFTSKYLAFKTCEQSSGCLLCFPVQGQCRTHKAQSESNLQRPQWPGEYVTNPTLPVGHRIKCYK